MSSGGSKKPKRRAGIGAAIGYYLTLPSRWLTERRERQRLRRQRDRSDNLPKIGLFNQIIRTILWPFISAGELIGGFFGSVGRYATTRNGIYLLQGIPAVVVLLGTIGLAIVAMSKKKEDLIAEYKQEGDKALKEATKENGRIKDEKTRQEILGRAQLCYERWMMLDNKNPEAKFSHAKASFESKGNLNPTVETKAAEDNEMALNEMRRLAPHFEPGGYKKAHEWLAEYYIDKARKTDDPGIRKQAFDLAEVHLMRVLIADNEDTTAHIQLARLYLQTSHLEKAERHLMVAEKIDKSAHFDLARIYEMTRQPGRANQSAQIALSHFKAQSDANPDDLRTRLIVADAYVLLRDYQAAIETLQEGIKLTGGSKEINQKWAEILLKGMLELPSDQVAERMNFLDQAIKVDPANEPAFKYLLRYLQDANPVKAMAQERIDEVLATTNSASFHLLLSDYYLAEGQNELAQKHLEAVLRAQPQSLTVMNNLASVYALAKPPDFNRALDMINACIKFATESNMSPVTMGYFYDTRGQIYVARRQWNEAITDLEKAVGYGLTNNLNTRNALLRCYQELGKKSLAEQEARVIAQLKKATGTAKPAEAKKPGE